VKAKSAALSLQRVLIPVVPDCGDDLALRAACALAPDVVLVGLVRVPLGEALSIAAAKARQVREQLRRMAAGEQVRYKARVRVSHTPWAELHQVSEVERPDLLLMEWGCQLEALGVSVAEGLSSPPCDIAMVRAPFPQQPRRVLVPVRGGPHAELALRLALALRPEFLRVLHLRVAGVSASDAPFRGLERVLRSLPEVDALYLDTSDAAQTILAQAQDFDLVVMGTSALPIAEQAALGSVADRILRECPAGVITVKTSRGMPLSPPEEIAGARAISILVDKWFAENTFEADEFADLDQLVRLKRSQGLTISLALPALNEEETVGSVIRCVKGNLLDDVALLDEIVLIDSDSTDRTRQIAAGLGVPTYVHQQVLRRAGPRNGKGEALWKSLYVTKGDIIAWIDTDIVNIHPRFVYGIVGPLLVDPRIQFVKGFYRRPLRIEDRLQVAGGGRVTELTARPLLNLFYPELSGVIQPLSGEYAGRRRVLERVPFFSGYGVETGLLIDIFEEFGLSAIAQVDLQERIHHNQPLEALSKMSFAIIQAVIRKLERRYQASILEDVNKSMKLIRHHAGAYSLEVEEIVEHERPPMVEIAEYAKRRGLASQPAEALPETAVDRAGEED